MGGRDVQQERHALTDAHLRIAAQASDHLRLVAIERHHDQRLGAERLDSYDIGWDRHKSITARPW